MPCWIDEEYTTVRVHDLPPEMPHKDIWADMAKYGKITQIYPEYWRTLFVGVKNGVRIIKMVLNKPIPSYVVIGGYRTGCTYEGQQATSRYCNNPVHRGKSCASAAANSSPSSSSEPTLESNNKNDKAKNDSGRHTQQRKPAIAKTINQQSSSSSSPPPSPQRTKQQSTVERPTTGLGFTAVLEQLSNNAAYPDLPPPPSLRAECSGQQKYAQIKRQHSLQIDDDQKRTRAGRNSNGSPIDSDVAEQLA